MLRENADKLTGPDKEAIDSSVAAVKEALKGTDTAAIKSALDKLNEAWQKFSEILYKAAAEKAQAAKNAPGAGPSAGPDSAPGGAEPKKDEGPIIDAEVVDEAKK
jgi:molecular chaperone DnaK